MAYSNPEDTRAYQREWAARNPDKVAAYQRKYQEANREERSARAREKYAANREKYIAKTRAYKAANREKVRARERERRAANREKERAQARQRYAANRDREIARNRAYNAAYPERRAATQLKHAHGIRPEELISLREKQDGCCYLCRRELGTGRHVHLDHDHAHCAGERSCRVCQRGLACDRCNKLIGLADDDPARLRLIADNLEEAIAVVRAHMAEAPMQLELGA